MTYWARPQVGSHMIEFVIQTKKSSTFVHIDSRTSVCLPMDQLELAVEALDEQIEKLRTERARLLTAVFPEEVKVG
jgi:hypothetical protein